MQVPSVFFGVTFVQRLTASGHRACHSSKCSDLESPLPTAWLADLLWSAAAGQARHNVQESGKFLQGDGIVKVTRLQ